MFLHTLAKLRARHRNCGVSKRSSRSPLRVEPLEDRRLMTVTPLNYISNGGAVTVDISADHLSYEVRNNSNAVVASQLIANTSEIDIQGSLSTSNELVLNFGNALSQPTAVTYSAVDHTQGSIFIANGSGPSLTIDYALFDSAIDSIVDELGAANRNFLFKDDGTNPETITLAAGSSSGSMQLGATNALPVAFLNPTTSLSITEQGLLADTISLASVDANYTGSLIVTGGNELVDVEPTAFKGSLTINAGGSAGSVIDIAPSSLSITGNATFLASLIAMNATTFTSTGNQTYGAPLALDTTPITLTSSGGNIMFSRNVDGASDLTVNAQAVTFADTVGATNALKSLTVNAGTIQFASPPTTSGAQNFSDPTPASLSGSVYVDANDNGVFDTGETALAGVVVTLTGTNDLGIAVSLTATTAANGSYSFISLRPGTYTLTETLPANFLTGTDTVGSQGGTLGSGVIASIALTNGIVGTANNFAELVPASLSGYVYVDANNNGSADAGEPTIAGAVVKLTGTNDQGNAVSLTATTGVNGSYSFINLRPGTYTLTETRPNGYTDGTLSVGSQGGTAGVRSISGIAVVSGTNGQNNNFANLAPASLSGAVFVDSNDNGTFDTGETGIAGVTITLAGTDTHGNAVNLTTTTGTGGAYQFTNLVPGTYSLSETEPSGFLPGTDAIGSQGGNVVGGVLSNIQVALGAIGIHNNFAELQPASLSGFAYVDANANGRFDSGETPLAGVSLVLTGSDDQGNAISLTTATGSNGSYTFGNLRPGNYSISEAQLSGYVSGAASIGSQANGTAGSSTISAITLTSGTSGTHWDRLRQPAPAARSRANRRPERLVQSSRHHVGRK